MLKAHKSRMSDPAVYDAARVGKCNCVTYFVNAMRHMYNGFYMTCFFKSLFVMELCSMLNMSVPSKRQYKNNTYLHTYIFITPHSLRGRQRQKPII